MVTEQASRPAGASHGRTARAAFTLVELLVVIGIIALLISILMPALSKARGAAQTVQCASNLRTIGQAIHMYVSENKGTLPYTFAGYDRAPASGNVSTPWFTKLAPATLYLDLLPNYGIKSNNVRICPVVAQDLGDTLMTNPNVDYWNYRYNAVLGGTQYTNSADPSFSFTYDAAKKVAWARPMKLSAVRNSSNVAMLTEGSSIFTWANATAQQFRLAGVDANGHQTVVAGDTDVIHSVRYTGGAFTVPWAPTIRLKKVGITNICFADGSVRGVSMTWDSNPPKPWDDGTVKIDPNK
jgi:prepilin-type N-terminal cleavage/methylation domain-containing protein/prepilin-type processing-associated H-X9-DG protein